MGIKRVIKALLKPFICDHEYQHIRTIHGDEIIGRNFARSEWMCFKCGSVEYSKDLYVREERK